MSQTMTPSPADLRLHDPVTLPRARVRVALALAVIIGLPGLAYLGVTRIAPHDARPASGQERSTLSKAGLDKASLNALDLSKFQKRGNVLVGEITTRAGVRLRLVLDARSHELLGMRVVETEAGAGR